MNIVYRILGLTPSGAGSSLNIPSPLMMMASLWHPRHEHLLSSSPGAARVGLRRRQPQALHQRHNPRAHHQPTSPYGLTGRWQTEASYIVIASTPGIRLRLDGLTASFSTSTASILLPDTLVYSLLRHFDFEEIMFMPPLVEREPRVCLRDITVNLAGRNFTLTPYDYTSDEGILSSLRQRNNADRASPDQLHNIFLGLAFLRTFYSVFDLDTNIVGCKFSGSFALKRIYSSCGY